VYQYTSDPVNRKTSGSDNLITDLLTHRLTDIIPIMIKLLDFWAEWCGPCKFMEPILADIKKELAGKVEVVEINVDEQQDKAAQYQVMSIPTYVIEKDGQEVDRIIGATGKENLLAAILKHE